MKDSKNGSKPSPSPSWMMMPKEEWEQAVRFPPVFCGLKPLEWKNTLFIGPAGSGKSHKAARMLHSLYDKRAGIPIWVNIPKMLFDLRREFDNEVVERILRKDHVVLDDLGAEHTTDWVTETIYIIVNHIWENKKNLIVTGNLDVPEIADRFGDRLASRILDICKIDRTDKKDFRLEGVTKHE